MSAKKARFIKRIDKNDSGSVRILLKQVSGDWDWVYLSDLSRVELIRAAAMLGIQSGGGWTTWMNEDIITAIQNAVITEGKSHDYGRTDSAKGGEGESSQGGESSQDRGDGEQGDGQGQQEQGQGQQGDGQGEQGESQGQQEGEQEGEAEAQAQADADHPLLERLRDFIEETGAIDEDKVKAIVDDAVSELRPHVTQIQLPDGELREVGGRQHEKFDLLMTCIQRKLNCYLVGPPGTGKSYTTNKVAEALGLGYASISFGPQTPESRLWGYHDAHGNYVRTPFRDAYELGRVFCGDEIDNGHPGIIASLNQAIAGDGATFPDGWVDKHPNFVLVATANTFGTGPTAEFVGRNILDPATLDRFVTIEWPIDVKVERMMIDAWLGDDKAKAAEWHKAVKQVRKNAETYRIRVVCSPRSAQDGAALIGAGLSIEEALDMRVIRGIGRDQRSKLMEGVLG